MNRIFENILSYYGGFIDGEGHIGIKKTPGREGFSPTYSERISVAGICELSIRSLNDLMPGYVYFRKPSKLSKIGIWSWELTDNKAKIFLRLIKSYLKIKRIDVDLVLALSRLKEKNGRRAISKKELELRENLYLLTKRIHHKNE